MKFVRTLLERQNRQISNAYGVESTTQFRASNMCHIMAMYMSISAVLFLLAIFYDIRNFNLDRIFLTVMLGLAICALLGLYTLTLKGYFKVTRFVFLAANAVLIVPAILLTGGLPKSGAMLVLPLPILYAFCLFGSKKSKIFTVFYIFIILGMILIPRILGVDLPNISKPQAPELRRIILLLILIIMLSFTLVSLQYENKRALSKAKQAAVAKSDFLANMSHEIRTPMNGVLGLTDVLMMKPMPPDQKELLRVVQSSGHSLLTIINDILDFSKLDAGQVELDPRPFNLKSVLNDICDLMDAQVKDKNLYLKMDFDAECPEGFIGDDGRLRQIFLNVIGNAIKFTEDGGVTISVHSGVEAGVNIDIQDTGIGVDPKKLEHIFDQFTQADNSTSRRFGGTGLGLSISRKLAQTMGGDIIVQSEVGKGATFSICLPLSVAPLVAPVDDRVLNTIEPSGNGSKEGGQPKAQTVMFLSRSQVFFDRIRTEIGSSDYECVSCMSVGEMRSVLNAQGMQSPKPAIIVLEWARSLDEFLPYAEKLKSLINGGRLKFVLCPKVVNYNQRHVSEDIVILNPPHNAATLLQAIEDFENVAIKSVAT